MQHTGCNIGIILQCAGCNIEIILQCAALCRWAFCLSRVWDIISNISNSPKTEGDTPGKSKFGYPYRRNQRGFISRDHVLHLAKLTHVGISVSPRDAVLTFCACSQKKRWRKAYPLCNVDSIHSSNVHSNQNHVHSSQTTHIPLKQWLLLNYTGCDQEL